MALLACLLSPQQAPGQPALVRRMLESPPFPAGETTVLTMGSLSFGWRPPLGSRASASGRATDGEIAVILDGRLDRNRGLSVSESERRSSTDAELVAKAYQRSGPSFLEDLYGDFALIVWNNRSRSLVAARDTFGLRPLYYWQGPTGLAIATDPEQLITLPDVSRKADPDTVIDYLLWNPTGTDRSFFKSINTVPGGHALRATTAGANVAPYRSPALRLRTHASREAYYHGFRVAFENAVRRDVLTDGPVVAELSGGLDSSSIVCVADALARSEPALSNSVVVGSARYPGLPTDEGPYIEAVVEKISFASRSWDGTIGSVNELEDDRSLALPGGRFATFAGNDGQVDVLREVGARALITGFGGDQIGTSSAALRDAITECRWRDFVWMMRDRPNADLRTVRRVLSRLLRSFVPSALKRLRPPSRPSVPWLSEWARDRRRPRPQRHSPSELSSEITRSNWYSLSSPMHAFGTTFLTQYAVRAGIQFRVPFLDADVVAAAFSIPSVHWPPAWPFERLHRDILADVLPAKVMRRRGKAAFDAALRGRVRRHMAAIRDSVSDREWASAQFVNQAEARRLAQKFEASGSPGLDATYGLWAVAMLETWMRRVLRYAAAPMGEQE